jgi:hypothetical protein
MTPHTQTQMTAQPAPADLSSKPLCIQVAERLGWTAEEILAAKLHKELCEKYRRLPRRDSFSGLGIQDEIERLEGRPEFRGQFPNWTTSRDAAHELLAGLTTAQRIRFVSALCRELGEDSPSTWRLLFAPVESLCAAWLKATE